MYDNITISVNSYLKKIEITILDLLFQLKNPLDNKELLMNSIECLLDDNNNSLFKKQLQKISSVGISNITQANDKILIDFDNFYKDFVSSNLFETNSEYEKEFNKKTLDSLNILFSNPAKKVKLKKFTAEKVFSYNIKQIEEDLQNDIKSWNVEELLITVYLISTHLSIISSATYSKLTLKESFKLNNNNNKNSNLIIETLNNMSENELITLSSLIGEEKMNCDTLFNKVYRTYMLNNDSVDTSIPTNTTDILILLKKTALLCKMKLFQDSIALSYEKGNFFYIHNYLIYADETFQKHLSNFMQETISVEYHEEMNIDLQKMYRKIEGFSSNSLMDLITYLSFEQQKRNLAGIQLEQYPVNILKKVIVEHCDISENGLDKLINSILLQNSNDNKLDYKNKISICPLVKLKNDTIIFTLPMLLQAFPLLCKRMSQQSFTQNKRLKNYFQKKYDEALLQLVIDEFNNAKIKYWEHVHLDKISNKVIKKLFTKGITREIDLAFYKNNIIYFIEYKNWATTAFNIRNMLNEYKKVENNVKQHINSIKIIEENKFEYKEIFGDNINENTQIKLIMLFQNPNSFNMLNTNNDVIAINFDDFIKQIKNKTI